MNKVMVFGTFDIFHPGHENFLQQARQYGDYIVAVIARDDTVIKIKKKAPVNNESERLKVVENSQLVTEAVLGGLGDKYEVIRNYRPDIICLGYDQEAFTDKLADKLKTDGLEQTQIVRLKPYFPEKYKSSIISTK